MKEKIFNAIEELDKENQSKAIVRKDGPSDKPYCIYSKDGKNLGCYSSKDSAEKRLKEIEMFKHMKENK